MIVDVVAAIIERPDGHFLIAQRPPGKVYAGWWEFPGGKIEAGESGEAALARELDEELGVSPTCMYRWITRVHRYEHATVRLNFYRVTAWDGDPHPREGQTFVWQAPGAATVEPMLPANAPVLAGLALPRCYAITDAGRLGTGNQLRALEDRLSNGLRLICIREPELAPAERVEFTGHVLSLAHRYGARVLVKPGSEHPAADGLHLTARHLASLSDRPAAPLVGASCHSRSELARAGELGLDFAVVGPVHPTRSHPGAETLGWDGFRRIADGTGIPVFAIGGLSKGDMTEAWRAGAHGVAMISAAWA